MKILFLPAVFFLIAGSSSLMAYQQAKKIIQEQLVDNPKEQIGIRSQLTEEEANEIISFLEEKGIHAQKRVTASNQVHRLSEQIWEVTVSPTDTVESIILLDEANLPKRKRSSIFEEFISRIREGYTMTDEHEALAQQIENYVEQQPGIVNAEVLIKWEKEPLQKQEVLKVLLYIRHTGTLDDPHSELGESLKKYLLDNVNGLEEEHIIYVPEREASVNYNLHDYEN